MPATIAAVKYACDGEAQKEFQIPVYKDYHLPHTHDIFQKGEVSEISRLIGMTLVLMRLRPSLLAVYRPRDGKHRYINGSDRKQRFALLEGRATDNDWTAYANYGLKEEADYFPNKNAALLMAVCSAAAGTNLLHPPEKWVDQVGSVLIARQDQVPLHPMHTEILKMFIVAIRDDLMEKSQGRGITASAIANIVTPEMWHSYWAFATTNMIAAGQGDLLEGVACPFDLEHTAEAEVEDGDGGGVQLGADSEMMDFSDEGFTQ